MLGMSCLIEDPENITSNWEVRPSGPSFPLCGRVFPYTNVATDSHPLYHTVGHCNVVQVVSNDFGELYFLERDDLLEIFNLDCNNDGGVGGDTYNYWCDARPVSRCTRARHVLVEYAHNPYACTTHCRLHLHPPG